ncbi:translation initiation factor eIF-2B [Ktedonospora formicarum]|uniref:Translation initiation factor eIF2B subunit beta n=1 Tax=Ktedonospora formicarum TaxID=2778364 RepID=A0A8J3MSL9_9CHLR|nr:hypothetical protein [Ktedonospora formicarum]GHO43475.1 translation initiation factor IF-2 [Ktedonospora formicarum]
MQTFGKRIEQIVGDRDHGSRWLVREAILLVREMASGPSITAPDLRDAGRKIASARPAMSALASAMSRILDTEEPSEVARRASGFLAEYDTATKRIAEAARERLSGQVMTCSLSHTLVEVLTACRQGIERVYVLEGRPRYEGRTMAQELTEAGIPVTFLTDAQAALFLPFCQCVALGADSILADGAVINKAGSALLGWAAQGYRVPLYVLAETLKISPRRWDTNPAHFKEFQNWLEEKDADEVWSQPPAGVEVRNFYFDVTPAHLIGAWITERGVLTQSSIADLASEVQRAIQRLFLDAS